MNKQALKARTKAVLLQIHRGFLTKEVSDTLTDEEVLASVPESKTSWYTNPETGGRELRLSPFTFKWVRKHIKRNPNTTAYELLTSQGFTDTTTE